MCSRFSCSSVNPISGLFGSLRHCSITAKKSAARSAGVKAAYRLLNRVYPRSCSSLTSSMKRVFGFGLPLESRTSFRKPRSSNSTSISCLTAFTGSPHFRLKPRDSCARKLLVFPAVAVALVHRFAFIRDVLEFLAEQLECALHGHDAGIGQQAKGFAFDVPNQIC